MVLIWSKWIRASCLCGLFDRLQWSLSSNESKACIYIVGTKKQANKGWRAIERWYTKRYHPKKERERDSEGKRWSREEPKSSSNIGEVRIDEWFLTFGRDVYHQSKFGLSDSYRDKNRVIYSFPRKFRIVLSMFRLVYSCFFKEMYHKNMIWQETHTWLVDRDKY